MQIEEGGILLLGLSFLGTLIGSVVASLFVSSLPKSRIGFLTATAAGMMTGCGLVLLEECSLRVGYFHAALALLGGCLAMKLLDEICVRVLSPKTFHFSGLYGTKAIRLFIMLMGLVIHSVGEGLSLGLSAADGSSTGIVVALSLAIHNIPETAALVFSFRAKGASHMSSIILGVLSSLPQCLVAFPSVSVFSSNLRLVEYGMGVSAGCMAYAVLADVYPEAVATIGRQHSLSTALLAGALVVVFDIYSHIQIR